MRHPQRRAGGIEDQVEGAAVPGIEPDLGPALPAAAAMLARPLSTASCQARRPRSSGAAQPAVRRRIGNRRRGAMAARSPLRAAPRSCGAGAQG
ncbi:hypothetical protein CKO45_21265 [Paracraurococcus ruber]|uniref:Uncharacterized protein n=1 Tax=Paracraurococcus ruber TaxID=77675 RepID=A0ABS1D2N4_9PROT|nr:hypothetical protein [Paracraurococcus ruber]